MYERPHIQRKLAAETRRIQQILGSGRPSPLFICEEDFSMVRQGAADLVGRPPGANEIIGLDVCKNYLKDTVTKVWERIESRLKPFDRVSVVLSCFDALNEVARDEEHWDMSTRALFALHQDKENVFEILSGRRSERARVSLCNRLIIETVQYACGASGGRMFTEADHLTILADMELLILLANHRDAIAYGFIKPRIGIFANGDLEIDEDFYNTVMNQYITKRARAASEQAASDYESYFPEPEPIPGEETKNDKGVVREFDKAFTPEFGFSVELLFKALDEFRTMAVKTELPGGKMTEELMQSFLRISGFKPQETEAFLNRFSLPIRSAWDAELPQCCRQCDVYPWRLHNVKMPRVIVPHDFAGFQPAVSPISNRQIIENTRHAGPFAPFAGWKPCDTAGWKPALLSMRLSA